MLEENIETLEGWKNFYDEETGGFGPTGHSEPNGYVYNFHDTFIAAFKSM